MNDLKIKKRLMLFNLGFVRTISAVLDEKQTSYGKNVINSKFVYIRKISLIT